jgi:ribonucleoside-diphosphate reductase alpha chain
LAELEKKAEIAAILGTLQATLTNFRYLRKKWNTNCEDERLLGVSLTGIMDHPVLSLPDPPDVELPYEFTQTLPNWNHWSQKPLLQNWLTTIKAVVERTNIEWSAKLGIKPATSITCVKPSGTVSQLVNSASGIHTRWSRFYIRRIRQDLKDPMTQVLMNSGVPWEPDLQKPNETVVFSFPMKAPDTAVVNNERTALEQLEHWLVFKEYWATHSVSATIYVREDEWLEVGAWVYRHFDAISGLSFLPYDGGIYPQAPYEVIDEATYLALAVNMPKVIDWDVSEYSDLTAGVQTLACSGGSCEVV